MHLRFGAVWSVVTIAVALLLVTPGKAQSPGVLVPADNLIVEGIPAIPANLVEEVKRYTDFRSAGLADWHPSRREVLITTRFGNSTQIHLVKTPAGARQQLTFFNEPVTQAEFEPRQGNYVVFRRDVGGNEFWQLYRLDLGDGRATLLTDSGRSQNGSGAWSNAGGRIAYTSTRRNGADRDIYVMDPLSPASSRMVLEARGGGWAVLDWSPDDRHLLVRETISVNQSHLHLLEVATGLKTEIAPPNVDKQEPVAHSNAAFSVDGRGIYLTTDKGSEFLRLAYMDLASKQLTPITSDIAADVETIALSRDRRRLAFSVNELGVSKPYLLDITVRLKPDTTVDKLKPDTTINTRYRPIAGVPDGVISRLVWHANGRDLGIAVGSARSVSDVYSVDVDTQQITRWTESELGGLRAEDLSTPSLIRWRSFDGREITGFYSRPPARFTGRRPVIVNIHGGPEGQSRPTFLGRTNYYLHELGVALIYPNVRGSTGFGKTFVKLDNGLKREDSVKDIGALLDWIAKQPDLDPSRVLITGGSYGGYMTLAVAMHYSDRICCAVDSVGISNFNTFFKSTEAYRRDLRRVEYGDERDADFAAFFEKIAPLNHTEKISKPLFVIAGGNDPRVPRTESEQIAARVRKNGTPVWFLLAKDEGHGFQKKANQDFQFYATVMFARRYLLGEGASAGGR